MRNYELLEKIWSILHINQARPETKVLTVENLLKRERTELSKEFRVVDPDVLEARYIENIIGLESVRTTVWRDSMDY